MHIAFTIAQIDELSTLIAGDKIPKSKTTAKAHERLARYAQQNGIPIAEWLDRNPVLQDLKDCITQALQPDPTIRAAALAVPPAKKKGPRSPEASPETAEATPAATEAPAGETAAQEPAFKLTTADIRTGWTKRSRGVWTKDFGAVVMSGSATDMEIQGPKGCTYGKGKNWQETCRAAEAAYNAL